MATERLIFVAVGGSKQAEDAFKHYLGTFHQPNHKILFMNVVEMPHHLHEDIDGSSIIEGWRLSDQRSKEILQKFKGIANEHGVMNTDGLVKRGVHPGQVISDAAKEKSASAVVMGTRGLGTIRRTIMGSVSDYVLHHAHCPVVVYRK